MWEVLHVSRHCPNRSKVRYPKVKSTDRTGVGLIFRWCIYDFKDRKEKRGERIALPSGKDHGYNWKIHIYPRGCKTSDEDTEFISCYFACMSDDVTVRYSIRCKQIQNSLTTSSRDSKDCWGYRNWLKRDRIFNEGFLEDDGSLVIKIDFQISAENNNRVWYPKEFQKQDTLAQLYQHAASETSDVTFSVGKTSY